MFCIVISNLSILVSYSNKDVIMWCFDNLGLNGFVVSMFNITSSSASFVGEKH